MEIFTRQVLKRRASNKGTKNLKLCLAPTESYFLNYSIHLNLNPMIYNLFSITSKCLSWGWLFSIFLPITSQFCPLILITLTSNLLTMFVKLFNIRRSVCLGKILLNKRYLSTGPNKEFNMVEPPSLLFQFDFLRCNFLHKITKNQLRDSRFPPLFWTYSEIGWRACGLWS